MVNFFTYEPPLKRPCASLTIDPGIQRLLALMPNVTVKMKQKIAGALQNLVRILRTLHTTQPLSLSFPLLLTSLKATNKVNREEMTRLGGLEALVFLDIPFPTHLLPTSQR